jgi:hypothetical protein
MEERGQRILKAHTENLQMNGSLSSTLFVEERVGERRYELRFS